MKRLLVVLFVLFPVVANAATTRKVYAGGTSAAGDSTYTNAQLQSAIDDAAPGDTILLETAITYSGQFIGKFKSCPAQNDTCYITIKTGVTSTGTVMAASSFPEANVRVTVASAANFAKLTPTNNNGAAFAAENNGASSGAYYKIQFIEFIGNSFGGSSIVLVGSDSPVTQPVASQSPHHFYFDQVYVHGNAITGQRRGFELHGRYQWILNSRVDNIKSVLNDGQDIWVNCSLGPTVIENNYLSGGTEVFLTGGTEGCARPTTTVLGSPAPTTTTATVSAANPDWEIGQDVTFTIGGLQSQPVKLTGISGANLTFTALPSAPDVGGAMKFSVRNKDLTFRLNYLTRSLNNRNPIVPTPTNVQATGNLTGGTLIAGNYFYKVVARMTVQENNIARSTASSEVTCTTTTSTGSCVISWNAVQNAETYYIYGRSSGGQNIRFSVTAPTTTFTDTGGAGTAENVPTSTGTKWTVKNAFEFKNQVGALVEGNVFENAWNAGQTGYLILFTSSAEGGDSPSATVRDVEFRYNIVRSASGGFQLGSRDQNGYPNGRNGNIKIHNNLMYDLNDSYGTGTRGFFIFLGGDAVLPADERALYDLQIYHNTVDKTSGNAAVYFDLKRAGVISHLENFVYRDNIAYKLSYGIMSTGGAQGDVATYVTGNSVYDKNIFAGASCSIYPVGTFCPAKTDLQTLVYSNYTNLDFDVKSTSTFFNAGTDGKSIGADIAQVNALTAIAISGDNRTVVTPPPAQVDPLVITTVANLPAGQTGVNYTATFQATGGTGNKTWSLSSGSTLPTGMTLSTNGFLSGTTNQSGSFSFTVAVTDSATIPVTTTKTFTLNIIEIIFPEPRPDKIGNYQERGIFARDVCPTDPSEQVKEGDICYDQTAKTFKYASTTAGSVNWSQLVNTGITASNVTNGLFITANSSQAWSLTTVSEELFDDSPSHRYLTNLTGMTQCRLWSRVSVSVPNAIFTLEYSTDNGATFTTTGVTVNLGTQFANNYAKGDYMSLAAGARVDDVWLRVTGVMTSGAATPTIRNTGFICKP